MTNEAGDGPVSSTEDTNRSPAIQNRNEATGDHQFQTLIEAVEEYAIFQLDPDGHVVNWNLGAKEIKGYTEAEIVGEHFSIFYTEEDRSNGRPDENLAAVAAQGSVEDEGWRVRKDGSKFWANVTITAIQSSDGVLQGFVKVTRDMTQRREYERQLEAQTERLEREREDVVRELGEVFERIDDGFYALDEEWRFTYVNDRGEEILGRTEGDLLGRVLWDAFPEVYGTQGEEEFRRAMGTQEPVTYEEYFEPFDGWFEVRAYPSETGLSVYFRDVTDRKQRERRYEAIFNQTFQFTGLLEPDGTLIEANETAREFGGVDREDVVGKKVWDTYWFQYGDAADRARKAVERARDGELVREELDVQGASRIATIDFSVKPVTDEQGEVVLLVPEGRDITEQRRFEETLSALYDSAHELLEAGTKDEVTEVVVETVTHVLEISGVAMYLYDDQEDHLYPAGNSVEAGFMREEFPTVPPDDSSITGHVYASGVAQRFDDITESPYLQTNATTMRAGVFVPMGDHGVLIVGTETVGTFDDRAQQLLEMVAANAQAAYDRVERQIELEESNQRLEHFAYTASHDLQEPLRMVSSYLQLIDSRYADDLDQDIQEFIDFANDGAERMREMINDLLAYSRIDTEARPFEPTDAEAVVENVLRDLALRIQETNANIDVSSLPTVDADPNQLEQVFQNLVSNAIKYRGEEPPRIEIHAERDGTEWVFHVADNGIGMDTAQTDRIFEVFDRLHTNEEYPGTGIGLAICRKIIDRHGGEIWVESEPGEGSIFYFTLPTAADR